VATPVVCLLLGLVDYKVTAITADNPIQIPEGIAVVANMPTVIHLQEPAICRWTDVILTHVVECVFVGAINGWLSAGYCIDGC
jgi:hypothetical protein